jgi:hypothetical protein
MGETRESRKGKTRLLWSSLSLAVTQRWLDSGLLRHRPGFAAGMTKRVRLDHPRQTPVIRPLPPAHVTLYRLFTGHCASGGQVGKPIKKYVSVNKIVFAFFVNIY